VAALTLLGPDHAAELAGNAGATTFRYVVDWRLVQPEPQTWHWSFYDAAYRALVARGIRPLLTIAWAPGWARSEERSCTSQDCTYPPHPGHDVEWREFARKVAQRYPQAAAIEVWNEPNLTYSWKPWPDPARFTQLLRLAYAGVKQARPDMPVVAGGFGNLQSAHETGIPFELYLKRVYAAGARGRMDAIGIHPYPGGAGDRILDATLRQARAVRDAAGDRGTPLWATEIGLTTTGRVGIVSEEVQASELVRMYRKLAAMEDVEAFIVHTMVEQRAPFLAGELQGYGVLRLGSLRPKPAYCALAAAAGGRAPC
jgi:hypothetical protein